MHEVLQTAPDTEAVIAVSDLVAFGALTEYQRLSIQVPRQVLVVAFGIYEIFKRLRARADYRCPFPLEISLQAAEAVVQAISVGANAGSSVRTVARKILVHSSSLGLQS